MSVGSSSLILMQVFMVSVLCGIATAVGVVLVMARLRDQAEGDAARAQLLADELNAMRAQFQQLGERFAAETSSLGVRLEGIDSRMTTTLSTTLESNQSLAQNIFDTLGDVRSATKTVADQAREFSALQDLLRAPKARGAIGEAMLEELLRQILPPQAYGIQHRFSSGAVVDAVVHAGGHLVCIDSKFPLANYRRMCDAADDLERLDAERAFAADVDRHIRDISTRYIVPDEGTFDFAVMYVPAEGVYGEVLRLSHRKRPLFEAAVESRVMVMSPLTMFGYLQTVLFGLKCLRIEEHAEAILSFCGRLQQDVERFATEYEVLGTHLGNARKKYEEGARRLDRFRDNLERVAELDDQEGPHPSLEVVNE
jgi:DNA recombination protein RmuC